MPFNSAAILPTRDGICQPRTGPFCHAVFVGSPPSLLAISSFEYLSGPTLLLADDKLPRWFTRLLHYIIIAGIFPSVPRQDESVSRVAPRSLCTDDKILIRCCGHEAGLGSQVTQRCETNTAACLAGNLAPSDSADLTTCLVRGNGGKSIGSVRKEKEGR